MKKKIAIIGSTGSIGKTLLNIIDEDKSKFEITVLTANKNYLELYNQAIKYNVKNLIIKNKKSYKNLQKKIGNLKINIFNNYNCFEKIFKKKIDYVMSSIIGLEGLEPTIKIIKYTRKIAIANKESIICAWNLISKELIKNKTSFVPVDSEHFSIWYAINNLQNESIEKIFITASGGPFYNKTLKDFKDITVKQALSHPNWKMGKKISVDSATMINKVYEVIEAKNIFGIPYHKIQILIHPKSYVHALLKFSNGLIKIIAHDTTMRIPIFNTLFFNSSKKLQTKKLNIKTLNNLKFEKVNVKKYPITRLLKYLNNKCSLYETIIVTANDTLVDLFLKKKIKFTDIQIKLFRVIKLKEFSKYKTISPKNIKDILKLSDYVRLKTCEKVYKSQNA